jgi:hypothetical protein
MVQLAPGVLATEEAVFATDSIPGYQVRVRDLVIGPNQKADAVPLQGHALMELRSGEAEVAINGVSTRRQTGDLWLVPRGARFAIRSLAEATIIRTTMLEPR